MNKLNERIKIARNSAGLTLVQLADKIGISLKTIKNYEKDSKNVTVDSANDIAAACSIDECWLLTGQGKMVEGKIIPHDEFSQTTPPEVKNQTGIIEQFKDQESALEINQDLLYIETQSRETFEKAKNIIKGMKEAVSVKTDTAHCSKDKKNSGFWNGQERRQQKTG